jgi:hypothetical protein
MTHNFTSAIPTFSWNDTNLLAGGLVMTVNLTCGAFVDPAQTPAAGTSRGAAGVWEKNALLQGLRARFPVSSGFTTGSARNGWESVRAWLLTPAAPPAVWFDHLGATATIVMPSLANTSYAPTDDEELTFTIPGSLLTSGRDTPVPMFLLRINTTLQDWDCKVGVWGAWTGCSVGLPQSWPIATCGAGAPSAGLPFCDPSLPTAARAADLTARLSLELKLALFALPLPSVPFSKLTNSTLGLAAFYWDVTMIHGLSSTFFLAPLRNSTCFPHSIGQAASWDLDLAGRIASAVAYEARVVNQLNFAASGGRAVQALMAEGGPLANAAHDPRWGRAQETYGEDPHLLSEFGRTFTRALQNEAFAMRPPPSCLHCARTRLRLHLR